ncbi:alpha/beta hydrolase [Nocardioides marmoriginsengisoli]|uniref:Alpha/beta hydrolase n=1 Tax=Nocardioides marmoriginsengisoli TaxID=661483 RepID=A0A3N0CHB7_9ACTN|nr:alpha/beta hydrolase [Nocardioides marmoriginsengisoli]RNL62847.1 alpha/beta hydrolase [Nocardioides marmoriginsengisoli]
MRIQVPLIAADALDRVAIATTTSSVAAEYARLGIMLEATNRRTLALPTTCLSHLARRPTKLETKRLGERKLASSYEGGVVVPDRALESRGGWVHWREGGHGEPLLLLNGWTASGLAWPADWIRGLEKSFRVIRIDNRGAGWSRLAPAPFTMAQLADDAHGVLQECGVKRATVMGLSMGGMIAQELALRHPDAVGRLFLVGTRPPTPAHISSDLPVLLKALRPPERGQPLDEYFTRMWAGFAAPGFAAANPEVMSELVKSILDRTTPRAGVLAQSRAIFAWHNAGRLATIQHPTVVVHGSRDPLIPVGNGMRLSRLIKNASYVEVPGAGHLLPYEAPDLVADLLQS